LCGCGGEAAEYADDADGGANGNIRGEVEAEPVNFVVSVLPSSKEVNVAVHLVESVDFVVSVLPWKWRRVLWIMRWIW